MIFELYLENNVSFKARRHRVCYQVIKRVTHNNDINWLYSRLLVAEGKLYLTSLFS